MINRIKTFLQSVFDFAAKELDQKPVTKKSRNKYDTTPLTDEQCIYIRKYKRHIENINARCNPEDYITQAQITEHLNIEFGLNKSTTTYRGIWSTPQEEGAE